MRNDNFEEDQKVYRFINSVKCEEFEDLRKFLITNALPCYERWVFYLLGKLNFFTEFKIDEMGRKDELHYGAHFYPEVFWWTEYLRNEYEEVSEIEEEITKSGAVVSPKEVRKIFIKRGWQYVNDGCASDSLWAQRLEEQKYNTGNEDYVESFENGTGFCDACQMSPCMCSDREKSSTIHDY